MVNYKLLRTLHELSIYINFYETGLGNAIAEEWVCDVSLKVFTPMLRAIRLHWLLSWHRPAARTLFEEFLVGWVQDSVT